VAGWHSLGASYDDDMDGALRQSSQDENLAKIRSLLGDPFLAAQAPLAGRVGFRCVAPDRLPLVGALPRADADVRIERLRDVPRQPGLYGLLGYASRGLSWAPLAAELLAAQLDGEPLPLEAELVAALDPARFLVRARRRL
jgi:tRNA 5-methylaminomethyl-2-thiouridine biosynthesis bifunctional protein